MDRLIEWVRDGVDLDGHSRRSYTITGDGKFAICTLFDADDGAATGHGATIGEAIANALARWSAS
jgi:hypothetical protein